MRDVTTWVLAAVAVGLAGLAWWQGGPDLALEGLRTGGSTLLGVVPLLLAAFLIAGLIRALVSRDMVERWLGSASGWRGIALGCLAGALIPGGPYVYYPIAAALLGTGASLGVLVAFVTAKNLWSVTRLPLEFGLLGPHLTLIRVAVTFVIPPLLGVVSEQLFGRTIESIREGAAS
jgi:uncharacterized membrane protein YraQ (UPF0718 family)